MTSNERAARQPVFRFAILLAIALASIGTRVWCAHRGHNYDMDTWAISASAALVHQNVYELVPRYDYGPVWFCALYPLGWFHETFHLESLGPESFHILIAGVLSLADLALSACLWRRIGRAAALFLLFNPVLILTTGYHSQIDTLAILPAMLSWMVLTDHPIRWRSLTLSAALLALSLATKHLFIFFPIWIAISPTIIPDPKKRIAYCALTYALFIASFIPFALTPESRSGIGHNVFTYSGLPFSGGLLPTVMTIISGRSIRELSTRVNHLPLSPLTMTFLLLLFATAALFIWRESRCKLKADASALLDVYLLSLVLFAGAVADQYLAIPLVVFAKRWKHASSWIYTVFALILLLRSPWNINGVPSAPNGALIPWPSQPYWLAQIWLLVMLFTIDRAREKSGDDRILT